jgi:hypothetical protein
MPGGVGGLVKALEWEPRGCGMREERVERRIIVSLARLVECVMGVLDSGCVSV